ncbi:uncharacterized protein LOC100839784 [Brachypodium distachyon]|uniref:uncharacterized protein LOC100839784 n=1 Tax=Brachypodium distachyon TaxID=15368 RepID=UPI0005300909|nr:uncharacterized protein LOC100839784 [Brachypodium distachyon]|eukprot:XP_010240755.1 uncharacterized protein LOC100839784 [Brachypodium distachyon]
MRQAISAGIALEHLRKPSIKPSPESESIFIPANSEAEVTPMDIDSGSGSGNPGTERPNSAEAMAIEPMEVDEPVFMTRPVPVRALPIMSYIKDGSLPEDEVSARQIQRRAKAYTIINSELYKRGVTNVLQRCVEPEEGQEILRDIHQVRSSCILKNVSSQGISARILLVECITGGRRYGQEVQWLPEMCQQSSYAGI